MKKKKSLIAVGALLLVVLVGTTIAYYTSSASFENVFNTGTYKVVTTEVFESPDNWMPGEEIPKTITSTNEGTVPAAVRVSYTEKWEDKNGTDITSTIDNGTAIINLDNTDEWTKEGNYYYYKYILNPDETTSSFMKSVTLNPDLNGVTCTGEGLTRTCESTNPASGAKYILTITKETIQADKYDTVWNTEVEITVKNSGSSSNNQGNSGSEITLPTMEDMCPGCKFIYTTNRYGIVESDYDDKSAMPAAADLTNDYRNIQMDVDIWIADDDTEYYDYYECYYANNNTECESGTTSVQRPYFLGLIESTTNPGKIGRAFACGIENGTPFCLEGYDISKWSDDANVGVLKTIFPSCDVSSSDSDVNCYGSSVEAYTYGKSRVHVDSNLNGCTVYNNGAIYCYAW